VESRLLKRVKDAAKFCVREKSVASTRNLGLLVSRQIARCPLCHMEPLIQVGKVLHSP